jgi:hypothetical protein
MGETLETKIGILTERIDNLIARMDRDALQAEKTDVAIEKLDARVTDLEKSRAVLIAAGGFVGAILGWLGNLALSLLTK